MNPRITLRVLSPDDFAACQALWQRTEGIVQRPWENESELRRFLARNQNLCWAATVNNALIGTVLCGHDGWRGYLYHLAVEPQYRKQGIAWALVTHATDQLFAQGIQRVHTFVEQHNPGAQLFWHNQEWTKREDLMVFSADLTKRQMQWQA
jgi:ribosomal protein S18 acetylase RimI-like enzyme